MPVPRHHLDRVRPPSPPDQLPPLRRSDPLLRHLLGATLRDARTEQGLTLREVAARARVSLPYLSEVERGRKEASSEVLAAVARALGLRLGDLLARAWQELADRSAGRAADRPDDPRDARAQRRPADSPADDPADSCTADHSRRPAGRAGSVTLRAA